MSKRMFSHLCSWWAQSRAGHGVQPDSPSDAQIEALAEAMYDATLPVVDGMRGMKHGPWATASEPIKASWRIIARTAWARGAR